ncbi:MULTISPECIES: glycosyltransferase family 2 protein [unclassified Thioalkalivibrio]|uniref:glycosyltransferase family 2 protein n=1 Tax=unclassified Thioalkalivibrio TaxID=2621013 RepID=UPI00036C0241|nr:MULTISPECIES: glycosyltransferase family 2 protein [unclassified Thioalkalivibrio]
MRNSPAFTVFIPAYNRAHTLRRALDSVREQTLQDYEILVVDDGSEDDTETVVNEWAEDSGIPVRYYRQPNGGKHRAHNRAVGLANGELLMVLDSDDILLPECLARVHEAWCAIPPDEREGFVGVEGLCRDGEGRLHGSAYPSDVVDGYYLEMIGRYGVTGEKRNALRVDVLGDFPYPEILGEYHVRPSYLWKQLSAAGWRVRFINEVLQQVEFQEGGLTRTASKRRLRNVRGLYLYWQSDLLYHQTYLKPSARRRHYAEYIRYALHSQVRLSTQWREVPRRATWIRAMPRALPNYLGDRLKSRRAVSS